MPAYPPNSDNSRRRRWRKSSGAPDFEAEEPTNRPLFPRGAVAAAGILLRSGLTGREEESDRNDREAREKGFHEQALLLLDPCRMTTLFAQNRVLF